MLGAFTAALIGFLIYNSNPASIFMGDSGSMFIGFFLAGSSLINLGRVDDPRLFAGAGGTNPRPRSFRFLIRRSLRSCASFPARGLTGRARSHFASIVALGLSEKRAVLMLYGLAALSGLLAVTVRELKPDVSIALLASSPWLSRSWAFIAGVKGYDEEAEVRPSMTILLFLF